MRVLNPVSPEASSIANIWWIFFGTCGAVYIIVIAVLLIATWRKRKNQGEAVSNPAQDQRARKAVTGAAIATAVILVILLGSDLAIQRSVAPRSDNPLAIRLTGHQWWWGAQYQNPNASDVFETANEIHVPIHRSIRLLLDSQDVIHSFWVPQIHGKKDLVPGHPTEFSFKVDRAGRYEGQCAEFCGYQHAHMGITIVAEEPAAFETWAAAQRKEAPPSETPSQIRGRHIFEHASCAMCHTVHGTTAASRVGPVLTHVASRSSLAAGTLPNTRDKLATWIVDPQGSKPGVLMPATELSKDDLNALLDFMETLR